MQARTKWKGEVVAIAFLLAEGHVYRSLWASPQVDVTDGRTKT